MIWFFLWIVLIILYYQHFIEYDKDHRISSKYPFILFSSVVVLALIVVTFFTNPELITFDYAYFKLGIFTLIPLAYVGLRKPFLFWRFIKASPFFIFLFLVFEVTSLKLDHWRFPGNYLGQVNVIGITFPIEEFIIWIIISSTVVMSYYELFIDDEK